MPDTTNKLERGSTFRDDVLESALERAERLSIDTAELRGVEPEAVADDQAEAPEGQARGPGQQRGEAPVPGERTRHAEQRPGDRHRPHLAPDRSADAPRDLADSQRLVAGDAEDLATRFRTRREIDHRGRDIVHMDDAGAPWPVDAPEQSAA